MPGPGSDRMPEWLAQRARLTPDRLALLCGEEAWTFAQLHRRVSAAARRLAQAGVRPGDRVALLARNGLEFVLVVHALPRLGAVLVPLNIRLTVQELAWQVRDAAPSLLIYDAHNADRAAALGSALRPLPLLPASELEGPAPEGWERKVGHLELSAVHSVIYTSGTGGRPKGAILTVGNHWWSAVGSALNLGLRGDDRWLACLPLYHVGGLAILLRSVIYGITAVVQERFDPAAVNRAIDEGATIVSLVPTMLRQVLEERGERPYPSTLRCLLVGGGPLSRALHEECARRGLPLVQTYGLTEAASQVATLSPEEALRRLGCVGKPLFPTEVRIQGEGGEEVAPGVLGEILVRGPTVTIGYLNRPEETERALRDGWLHTRDVGFLDQEGYLYVVDRRDDLIVSGGENVYPAEVEEVLCSHPDVLEAGVIGLPDEVWGQRVAAVVVLRPGARIGAEGLLAFCRQRLAGYKVPSRLRFAAGLPRNAGGKLLRGELRKGWPDFG